jgi:hypothetical protein
VALSLEAFLDVGFYADFFLNIKTFSWESFLTDDYLLPLSGLYLLALLFLEFLS